MDARPPTRPSTHDQPRLLADRVGRRADLGERALRALLPGEAAVLPRRRRPVLDAASRRSTRARSRRRAGAAARTGKLRDVRTPCSSPQDRGGGSVILPGPHRLRLRRPGLRDRRGRSRARAPRFRPVVRQRALRPTREIDDGGAQPRRSVPTSSGGRRRRDTSRVSSCSATARRRTAPTSRTSGTDARSSGGALNVHWNPQHDPFRFVRHVQGLRRRLPRRRRVHPAGGVSRGLRVCGMDGPAEGIPVAAANVSEPRLHRRSRRRADQRAWSNSGRGWTRG